MTAIIPAIHIEKTVQVLLYLLASKFEDRGNLRLINANWFYFIL
jgi:hypothetical protein